VSIRERDELAELFAQTNRNACKKREFCAAVGRVVSLVAFLEHFIFSACLLENMNALPLSVRTSGQILSSCAPFPILIDFFSFVQRGPFRVVQAAMCCLSTSPGCRVKRSSPAAGIFRVRGRSESMFISSDPWRRVHSLALSQLQRLSLVALKTVSD